MRILSALVLLALALCRVVAGKSSFPTPAIFLSPPTFRPQLPGPCQIPPSPLALTLLCNEQISPDTHLLTFSLPDADRPLCLPPCACILACPPSLSSSKPYTPIHDAPGRFTILVKRYPGGSVSSSLCSLSPGSTMPFSHGPHNLKKQYAAAPSASSSASPPPSPSPRRIGMLCGGTGVAPMIQALHCMLGNPEDCTSVVMLYGSRSEEDILARRLVEGWADMFPDRFRVTHVVSREPSCNSTFKGARGRIDRQLLECAEGFPKPTDENAEVWVCGPPAFYESLCGKKKDENISGVLRDMGFTTSQVYKF